MSGNSKKLIAFNYFGGKFTWLDYLYENFPHDFNHFVDLFGGSMVVSLNFKRKVIKTGNEIHSEITNFFEVLRNNENELIKKLLLTPSSNEEYNNCWEPTEGKIEQARRFYVRVRQSFFGLGVQRQNKGWHMAKTKTNANGGETLSKWNNGINKLHAVANEIRENLQITNFDYKDCIDKIDHKKAFFYCDPPYSKRSRGSYNDYKFEFTDNDHIELSNKLKTIKGMAMVSGYDCDLMGDLYRNWRKITFPVKRNNIRSTLKKDKNNKIISRECIWINYDLKKLVQLKLF